MDTKVLTVKADKEPMDNIENSLGNQVYKNPRLIISKRELGSLNCNDIRVKVIYVGVCGSDVHLLKTNGETGYIKSSVPLDIPEEGRVIGHEGVGLVIDVGSNVNHIKKGMYVTLESIMVCNSCDACKRGDFNQCRKAKLLGLEIDGIMGEVVDVNANLAHDVTKFIKCEKDLLAMACIEPAAVAYDACENASIKPGDDVIVFGAGPIGIYCAILSKLIFGAAKVHVVEPVEFRRSLAREWTEYVYENLDLLKSNVDKANIIIETSGYLKNVNESFEIVDSNGTIVLLARSGEPLFINDIDYMITNNINIIGSRGHLGGAFDKILKLQTSKKLELENIVTSVVNGLEGLKDVLEGNQIITNNCKVVVKISN